MKQLLNQFIKPKFIEIYDEVTAPLENTFMVNTPGGIMARTKLVQEISIELENELTDLVINLKNDYPFIKEKIDFLKIEMTDKFIKKYPLPTSNF